MAGYIYNLFLARFNPSLPAVSETIEEEWNKSWEAAKKSEKESGMVEILYCDANFASERWHSFGLERFPSQEAIVAHKKRILYPPIGLFNFVSTQVLLGSSDEVIEPLPPVQEGSPQVYKLWMARPTAAAYALSPEREHALMDQVEKGMTDVGGKRIAMCSCWSSERYLYFGIEQFPDLNAVQEYDRCLKEMSWQQYMDGDIVLGVRER